MTTLFTCSQSTKTQIIPDIPDLHKYLQSGEREDKMDGRNRGDIIPGTEVSIVLKKDQRSGNLTDGIVKDILTNSGFHPHGIKVRLESGDVGRVKVIKS